MMGLLLLAALAHGMGPQPLNASAWVPAQGDGSRTTVREQAGDVFANVTVDPAGRPIRCEVARSSGFHMLDARTCSLVMRRARFEPARDEAGMPLTGIYEVGQRWPGGTGTPGMTVDLAVSVKHLPAGSGTPMTVIGQVIAADGSLESCAVEQAGGIAALDRIACAQGEPLAKLGPARDAGGKPVRTLRTARILFTPATPGE